MSSISILLISQFGWKAAYGITGVVGALFGLMSLIFIREPERGRYLDEETKRKEKEKNAT
jgi:hypothetical protein